MDKTDVGRPGGLPMNEAGKPSSPAVGIPDADHFDDYDDRECGSCGGEGFTYGCSWDWQCDTYDEGEGTCLCTRRCEWCHPLTATEIAGRNKLRDVLAAALARDKVAEMRGSQAIEAGTAKTAGLGPQGESAVRQDAPKETNHG